MKPDPLPPLDHDDVLAPYVQADLRRGKAIEIDEGAMLRAIAARLAARHHASPPAAPLAPRRIRRAAIVATIAVGAFASMAGAAAIGAWWARKQANVDATPAPRSQSGDQPAREEVAPASDLSQERDALEALLINYARAALRDHLLTEAQQTLARHRTEFPLGQLREERDVLTIELHLARGDTRAAAADAAAYFQAYPSGTLNQRVRALFQAVTAKEP